MNLHTWFLENKLTWVTVLAVLAAVQVNQYTPFLSNPPLLLCLVSVGKLFVSIGKVVCVPSSGYPPQPHLPPGDVHRPLPLHPQEGLRPPGRPRRQVAGGDLYRHSLTPLSSPVLPRGDL